MTRRTLTVAMLVLVSLALGSALLVFITSFGDEEGTSAAARTEPAGRQARDTTTVSDLPMLPPPPILETDDY